ncbi:vesicular, overexpressed in cancer, prosurvival protein 1 isoform X2 [Macaca thibetana thibetana]|uniref:vesicular, overexpressed in cancer, prosurvival protein 1 isoform X2 n=1 Tax=Macaca thibetana thibetana TaxID=257877 RepID=UPI0021BC699A|nr:vesicular, overexpressed in cancer, prosurvival protein 1 isoform X2 [Macaca thibetana thibetana]
MSDSAPGRSPRRTGSTCCFLTSFCVNSVPATWRRDSCLGGAGASGPECPPLLEGGVMCARKPKSIAGILKDSIQPIIYAAPTRTAVAPGAVCGPSPYRGYGTSGAQQPGPPYYTDPGGPGMNPVGNSMAMAFQVPPNSPQGSVACPPPPAYCNTPPPPYEQVVKAK